MPADEEFLEQARARWTSIAGDRPALSAAVGLQRVLVERTVEILTSITPDMARLLTGPVQLAEKIRCGKPLLHDEILPVPVELLAPHLSGFCETLARGGAGDSARHIGDALREQRLDAGSMLSASLARDQIAFRQGAALLDLSADLLWLVAELAAGPFAFVLQEIARESSD